MIWLSKKRKTGQAHFTEKYIALNMVARESLLDYQYCMVGVDNDKKIIAIKCLTNNEVSRGDIDKDSVYNISILRTCARIVSKPLVKDINDATEINLIDYKLDTVWNEEDKTLELLLETFKK